MLKQRADVKSVVAAVVKREGHAVLNADDPLVYAMRDRSMGDIVLFSTKPEGESPEFELHLSRNGIGARIEKDTFVIRRGRLRIPIASLREVQLMLGGAAVLLILFGSVRVLEYAAGAWLATHLFVVGYEEPALRDRFDGSYDAYRANVRRWWPRLTAWAGATE